MRQWIADFTSKPISMPHRLENMDGNKKTMFREKGCHNNNYCL